MPRYVVERYFDQKAEQLGPATSQRAIKLMDTDFTDLVWEHSHVVSSDADGGIRTFCVYSAPNAESLRAHASAIGSHVVLNVYEIVGDVVPADIPAEGEPVSDSFN